MHAVDLATMQDNSDKRVTSQEAFRFALKPIIENSSGKAVKAYKTALQNAMIALASQRVFEIKLTGISNAIPKEKHKALYDEYKLGVAGGPDAEFFNSYLAPGFGGKSNIPKWLTAKCLLTNDISETQLMGPSTVKEGYSPWSWISKRASRINAGIGAITALWENIVKSTQGSALGAAPVGKRLEDCLFRLVKAVWFLEKEEKEKEKHKRIQSKKEKSEPEKASASGPPAKKLKMEGNEEDDEEEDDNDGEEDEDEGETGAVPVELSEIIALLDRSLEKVKTNPLMEVDEFLTLFNTEKKALFVDAAKNDKMRKILAEYDWTESLGFKSPNGKLLIAGDMKGLKTALFKVKNRNRPPASKDAEDGTIPASYMPRYLLAWTMLGPLSAAPAERFSLGGGTVPPAGTATGPTVEGSAVPGKKKGAHKLGT